MNRILSSIFTNNSATKPLQKPLFIIILLLAVHGISLVWLPRELLYIRIATGIMLVTIIAYLFLLLYKLNKTSISKIKDLEVGEFKYQKLFNSITDAVIVYSLKGELIDCNASTIQLLGYTKEELKRLKPTDVIHPEYLNVFISNQQKVREGESTLVESMHIRKDGSTVPVEISTHNFNVDGQKAVLSVVRDISERKKAQQVVQQQSDQLDALKRTTTEGLWILDMDGKLKAVNKAYCNMSGYTEG
jgi:PAS domain S-box-containing protein